MEKKNVLTNFTGIALMGATLAFSPVLIDDVSANAGAGAPQGETSSGESNSSSGSNSSSNGNVNKESSSSNSESSGALLSEGDQGDAVTDLQTKLQKVGYNLNVDGIYGPITQEKVVAFQLDQGWSGDGEFGNPTSNALDAAAANANENSSENNSNDGNNSNESESNESDSNNGNDSNESESNEEDIEVTVDPTPISTGNDSGNANSGDAVATAQNLVGSPYVAGGTTPDGFDSSGFINYVFNQQGKSLNRTHEGMWANDGQHVDSPSVGDVVFFEGTYKS